MSNLRRFKIILPVTVLPQEGDPSWPLSTTVSFTVEAEDEKRAAQGVSDTLSALCNKHIDETRHLIANYNLRHPRIETDESGKSAVVVEGVVVGRQG